MGAEGKSKLSATNPALVSRKFEIIFVSEKNNFIVEDNINFTAQKEKNLRLKKWANWKLFLSGQSLAL